MVAVGIDPTETHPVLVLRETAGEQRVLPVSIGLPEAMAIERERRGVTAPRPMSHQLICEVMVSFGRRLLGVHITGLHDGIFHADLLVDGDTRISSRVSDAVALALHADVPITVEDTVMERAGLAEVMLVDDEAADPAEGSPGDPTEQELEQFRRFLDSADPEDFGRS